MALHTGTASANKGDRYPVSRLKITDILSQGFDGASQLMTRHMGQGDIRVMPHPSMPVAAAQSRGCHLHKYPMVPGCGHGHILNGNGTLKCFIYGCSHKVLRVLLGFLQDFIRGQFAGQDRHGYTGRTVSPLSRLKNSRYRGEH